MKFEFLLTFIYGEYGIWLYAPFIKCDVMLTFTEIIRILDTHEYYWYYIGMRVDRLNSIQVDFSKQSRMIWLTGFLINWNFKISVIYKELIFLSSFYNGPTHNPNRLLCKVYFLLVLRNISKLQPVSTVSILTILEILLVSTILSIWNILVISGSDWLENIRSNLWNMGFSMCMFRYY